MATIGEINKIPKIEFEWKIDNFFSLSTKNDSCYSSPSFIFNDESWYMDIYPNGDSYDGTTGYIDSVLYRKHDGALINVDFSLGLKTLDGNKDKVRHYSYVFEEANDYNGAVKWISRSELLRRKSELVPSDVLTVVCTLKSCKLVIDPNEARNCISESSKILHKNKVLHDYEQLYLDQKNCDVVIKIKERDFPAHRAILTARSSVFESAFRNDMKEKLTGTIDIEDCNPFYFSDFLRFLYCGDIEIISVENVLSLFTTADKYDVQDLRTICVEFMKENISIDNFCDIFTLALQHSETELIAVATDFFTKAALKITETVKWQSFLVDNPLQSNELFIKALKAPKDSNE